LNFKTNYTYFFLNGYNYNYSKKAPIKSQVLFKRKAMTIRSHQNGRIPQASVCC